MIELQQLKTFCAVAEKKSFTKAEEIVYRTQSTISAQISALEKTYGIPLFDREREIILTESGKILYDYAKRILELVDESKDKIDELRQVVKGDLIIGASTIPGTYILPEILKKFKAKYPEVNISLPISDSKDVTSKILEHKLEIGAVGKKIKDKRLEYIELAKDRIVLAVAPNHKWAKRRSITLNDLNQEPFIIREKGSATRATVEEVLQNKEIKKFNVVMELGSTEAVKQGVKAGLGISFISEWAVKDSSLKEVKVKNLDIIRSFYIVFLKSGMKRHSVKAFIDFLLTSHDLGVIVP